MVETYQEKLDPNKSIGTIDLGAYVLLIYPRKEGGYFFRPYKSGRSDILDKTRDLAPNTISVFAGLDPDLLEMIQIGAVMAPQVTWRSSSAVLDEPQIQVTGRDAFGFTPATATLFDQEVIDMFTKPVGGKDFKAASLIYLNTSIGDIMGVAVRRNTPVVLLIAPAIEGSRASSKDGLNNFLSGILSGLSSKLTSFEAQVLNALAEASSTDYFQLPYDGATLGGKLQNNLLMQIYTARTFFLARNAEISGEGINSQALLEHFPYLKSLGKKSGLSGLFAQASQSRKLKIEPSLWDDLVEDASQGISLKNPYDKTPRPRKVTPLMQRGVKINAPQVMSPAEIAALRQQAAAAPAEPVISPEVKSREEVVRLAQFPLSELPPSLGQLATARPEKLSGKEVSAAVDRLKKLETELKKITSVRRKGRPPVDATPLDLTADVNSLQMFGVLTSQAILDFIVPARESDYVSSIEESTNQWLVDSDFQDTRLRGDAKARLAASLLSSPRLAPLAEHLKTALKLRDVRMINQAIDLINTSYLILVEKTLFVIFQAGAQLCSSGQEVEINNWAHYSQAAIRRLINLADQIG